ncbi:MAG: hypothetical protein OXN89_04720 [Bryobacterales bacterium]|nr:hypothetical protein [Bryobacterales bacterium]
MTSGTKNSANAYHRYYRGTYALNQARRNDNTHGRARNAHEFNFL